MGRFAGLVSGGVESTHPAEQKGRPKACKVGPCSCEADIEAAIEELAAG